MNAGDACPRCYALARAGAIRAETIMPLRGGAMDALAYDRSGACCRDCAVADSLTARLGNGFAAARVVTGNTRQESLRLPDAPISLIAAGLMEASTGEDALKRHHDWLDRVVPDWGQIGSRPVDPLGLDR